jgi:hypothetical protein
VLNRDFNLILFDKLYNKMKVDDHVVVEINCLGNLTKNTLYAVVILLIYTISSSIFNKLNFHYIHESGVCMIIGLIVNLVAYFFSPDVLIPLT